MKELNNLLAVVSHADDGEIVLAKAARLAAHANAALHVMKVVHEGFVDLSVHDIEDSQALKTFLLEAEDTFLEDLIEPYAGSGLRIETSAVWHKSVSEAILDVAGTCKADLILKSTDPVKGAHFRTPQDWALLRHATVPVMLVKPEPWKETPVVLAAVDVEAETQASLNDVVVKTAQELATCVNGSLKLISAFPSVEHWVGPITVAIDFNKVRARVKADIERKLTDLASRLGVSAKHSADEGEPFEAIEKLVQASNAQILVMGTVQRAGVQGMVIGNTSELILHHVNCDVLVTRV